MICPTGCGEVVCAEHGDADLTFSDSEDGFIYCGSCVVQYRTALGAVIHFCGPTLFERLASLTEADVIAALKEARDAACPHGCHHNGGGCREWCGTCDPGAAYLKTKRVDRGPDCPGAEVEGRSLI